MYIKYILLVALCLLCVACSTLPRPDLGKRKVAGKTYVAVQKKVCGITLDPQWEEQPTQLQYTQDMLREPAKWTLWIALPLALISIALSAVISVPSMSKKLAVLAGASGITAIGATAWLFATMYMLLFIPIVIGVCISIYLYTKNKGIRWYRGGH